MAHLGFDPTFGLRGTCASDVSGFGGWPLGVFVGIDGRPTIICQATSQTKADRDDVLHANRFLKPQFSTLRVVSFPADGKPVPIGKRTAIFGPDPTANSYAIRAIVSPDRIAVLGWIIRANRVVPTLWIFSAGPIQNGVAPWTLSRTVELTALSAVNVRQYAIGWRDREVIVVAPQFVPAGVQLLIYHDTTQKTAKVTFPRPATLDLPANFSVNLRAGGLSFVRPDRLYVGLTWEGLDPNIPGRRPASAIDQARASVIALRAKPSSFAVDRNFGARGVWLATLSDGEITTSDHLVTDSTGRPAIAGRAKQGTRTSLFAASLDPASGALLWTSDPGAGVTRPTGMAAGLQDRLLLCGTTRDWDINAPSDPGDAVAIRLESDGQPDAGFGVNGSVQFRLHGGTHPMACAETSAGEPLVTSIVPWGWEASATSVQPCVSRLTPAGDLDPTFGSAGLCRHDGLGSAELFAIAPSGRVWSAGIAGQFLGAANNPQFLDTLTVSQFNVDGELESTFGLNGIATFQLPQWDDLNVKALIPLANGGALLNGTATLHGVTPTTAGSWLLMLQSNGQIDTTFGGGRAPSGSRFYPGRDIVLLSELTNGSFQGFENGNVVTVGANGTPATLTTVTKPLINNPSVLGPSGDFYGLTFGKVANPFEVGLVRFRNGAIDTTFGAGGAQSSSTPGNPDPRFADLLSISGQARTDQLLGGDQTLALADGTFLTLWTLREDESVIIIGRPNGTVTTNTLLLLAWAADGNPRTGKVIKNPAGLLKNWLGWTYQCSVLQPDGSIIVCLAGDDANGTPGFGQPPPSSVSQIPYFCRLIPPNFDLDPAFGGGARFLAQRAPGCDFVVPQTLPALLLAMTENQIPVAARRIATDAVVAAIRCWHPNPAFGNVELSAPNLPLDGSVGIARLV